MRQYIVDAFTESVFKGNPAAVLILDKPLPDDLMASIAMENNLSETAFAVKEGYNDSGNLYHLRWLTPKNEVDMCGHATLATAFVIRNFIEASSVKEGQKWTVSFRTRSGILSVTHSDGLFELNFPSFELKKVNVTPAMNEALGVQPLEAYMGRDLLCVVKDEATVRNLEVKEDKVLKLDGALLHVTAPASTAGYDCVSRSFAPKHGISEDPVCGSGHCHIAPFWSTRLNKKRINAYQASRRGGALYCDLSEDRKVKLSGKAVLFAISELQCC